MADVLRQRLLVEYMTSRDYADKAAVQALLCVKAIIKLLQGICRLEYNKSYKGKVGIGITAGTWVRICALYREAG